MPITLSKMAANTAKVTIPVGEDTVEVVYYPARVTERVFASIDVLNDENNTDFKANAQAQNAVLCALVASWDVMRDDGSVVGINTEELQEVPLSFRGQVITAIGEDMRGNATAAQTKKP